MKYYKIIGLATCALLLISCFLPWTYYADLDKSFTGFFTEKNMYGRPGMFFTILAVGSAILICIDRVWAKRLNILFAALAIGYLIKTFIQYTSCYAGYCPEKRYGIYLLVVSCLLLLVTALFPDIRLMEETEKAA